MARQGRLNFTGSNSIGGLHQEPQRSLNQSVDYTNHVHSQSLSYQHANFATGDVSNQPSLSKQSAKEDLFTSDEVLHEYPESNLAIKNKFIKSVDEGTFTRMKQANNTNTSTLKERGSSHNTIEHVGSSQLNPFSQNSFPLQNHAHVRSSTITSKPRKTSKTKRNELI